MHTRGVVIISHVGSLAPACCPPSPLTRGLVPLDRFSLCSRQGGARAQGHSLRGPRQPVLSFLLFLPCDGAKRCSQLTSHSGPGSLLSPLPPWACLSRLSAHSDSCSQAYTTGPLLWEAFLNRKYPSHTPALPVFVPRQNCSPWLYCLMLCGPTMTTGHGISHARLSARPGVGSQ